MNFLRFKPIYQERIWGGRAFEKFSRDDLPAHGAIGESWEICDRPEANTRVNGGPFDGYSLREMLREHGDEIMGPGWHPERRFPILVKWLDSRERLSLQVHPPLAIAQSHGGDPKTETWYVAHAEPRAGLYSGLKRGVTRKIFEAALRRNAACECVHRMSVREGDSLHVPSGRLHAIDAGCLILEIQQNSDTTYRVYDWGRPRALHIDESLRCIDFKDFEPEPMRGMAEPRTLVECEHYRLREIRMNPGETFFAPGGAPAILSLISGKLTHDEQETLSPGENILLPAKRPNTFTAEKSVTILLTDRFC